jgi:histone H3/H4
MASRPGWIPRRRGATVGRRRVWVGKFHEPAVRPLAPIGAVVSDGLVISLAAVRLSVKNHIIITALRDHDDFDLDALARFARREVIRLADESSETAARIEMGVDPLAEPPFGEREVTRVAREASDRRPRVERELSKALRAAANDEAVISEVVCEAQDSASTELRRAVTSKLVAQQFDADPHYDRERATRIRTFVAIDLAELLKPPRY